MVPPAVFSPVLGSTIWMVPLMLRRYSRPSGRKAIWVGSVSWLTITVVLNWERGGWVWARATGASRLPQAQASAIRMGIGIGPLI